ncbi:MAG: putative glycosyltransferase EpsH [Candidatus Anoxychlamydiales bacterium]|nr:putative glycosyltransferase EpsH [Candidatus Anoxychlamydiales bacterium]
MSKKTLSIIVPNYNYSKYLRQSLGSILNQRRKPDEIIIIDDGSTDNSVEIIEDLIKDMPNAILIKNSSNKGVIYSMNEGLKIASKDYVCFAAVDDLLLTDFVYEQMQFVEKHPDICLCCSLPAFFRSSKDYWVDDFNINVKKIIDPDELIKIIKKNNFWIATHTAIIKTQEMKKIHFDNILKHHCDWYTVLNIVFKNKMGFIPKPLSFMRVHDLAYSRKSKKHKEMRQIYSHLLNKIDGEDGQFKKRLIMSRVLSGLGGSLTVVLLFRLKYWKYLPSVIYGKILNFAGRVKRKFLKIFQGKEIKFNYNEISKFLEKNKDINRKKDFN